MTSISATLLSWSITILMILCITFGFLASMATAQTRGIINTKHNLSKTGPGEFKALSEDRICVFCHVPHNANPQTPLWNKKIAATNFDPIDLKTYVPSPYTPYTSSTMVAQPPVQPTGASRLCLSCHDGTLALGEVLRPSTGIAMTVAGGIPSTSPSYLGTTLASHHPISFSYFDSLPNPELSPILPQGLLFYGNGIIQCSTCHDPHDNTNKNFLAKSNENSELCKLCHVMNGWAGTSHSTAQSTWSGAAPNPWPRTGTGTDFDWTTVKQNGCENCHTPHNAIGQKRLLNCYTELGPCDPATEEGVCFPCHNGHMVPPVKNIFGQFLNTSRHAVDMATSVHDPKESPKLISGHVECVDCHNSHMTNNNKTATPPAVSGRLDGVSGVTIDDAIANASLNEYEICFKCHASASAQSVFPPIPRVIQEYNTRLEFQTNNTSYHPVAGAGASSDVPSLIMPLTTSSKIYCTDCHSDESVANGGTGSRGPHGSQYAPILKEQYKTTNDNIIYSSSNFALCYRCHYESSVMSDNTFQKNTTSGKGGHFGHVQSSTPVGPDPKSPIYASCSVCHDPHGLRDNGLSGSHKRLINFDTRIVSALTGFSVPIFAGSGNRAGNCALVCHDVNGNAVVHDGSTKFSYGGAAAIGPGSVRIRW